MPPRRVVAPPRRGRPGLVGTMARTAVIAGTATAVAGSVSKHQQAGAQAATQQQAAQQQAQQGATETQLQMAEMQGQLDAMQAMQAQQAAPAQQAAAPPEAPAAPAAAPAPAAGDDVTAQLQKLAELKAAGVIDDAEFATAKAKLLAG